MKYLYFKARNIYVKGEEVAFYVIIDKVVAYQCFGNGSVFRVSVGILMEYVANDIVYQISEDTAKEMLTESVALFRMEEIDLLRVKVSYYEDLLSTIMPQIKNLAIFEQKLDPS